MRNPFHYFGDADPLDQNRWTAAVYHLVEKFLLLIQVCVVDSIGDTVDFAAD